MIMNSPLITGKRDPVESSSLVNSPLVMPKKK